MTALTIKGIPEDVVKRLRLSAVRHRRSLNSEVIVSLERSLAFPERNAAELIARLRGFHQALQDAPALTDAFLRKAKEAGRR